MKRRFLILLPLILACGPTFYQAPPPLSQYPERIPTKAWDRLLEEAQPASGETADDLLDACHDWVDAFPPPDPATIDELIERNRRGEFRIATANFLIEGRELAASAIPADVLTPYLKSRLDDLRQPPIWPAAPVKAWNVNQADHDRALADHQRQIQRLLDGWDERVLTAPPELLPNQLVRRGGLRFRRAMSAAAAGDFQAVIERFPDHPRAEVARFMLARCALATAREKDNPDRETQLQTSEDLFNAYLETHPAGRFADDATGWIGGIAADRGWLGQAISYQLRRLEIQPTREVTRSVLRECDQLITALFGKAVESEFWDPMWDVLGDEPDYDLLARHPLVARLFIHRALDPAAQIRLPVFTSNESGDRGTLEFLRRRITLPSPFITAALERLGRAVASSDQPLDSTSMLILGWSATRGGDHGQALALIDRGLALEATDELLHARAVILARLDRHAEAAAGYRRLFDEFPESPLGPPSHFDLAIALHRSGEAGEALLILAELEGILSPEKYHDRSESLFLHPANESRQWIDTIARFAPIDEIRAPLDRLGPGAPGAWLLRGIVRSRALAEKDFALAARHLEPEETTPPPVHHRSSNEWNPRVLFHLDAARWQREVRPLADSHRLLAESDAADPLTGALHFHAARGWQALRGRLSLPLSAILDYSASEADVIDQLRRTNARFIGVPPDRIETALDSLDELHHALTHYLAATELSTDPEIVAPALEAANEALFRLAEFSRYACSRAAETDATTLSDKLVGRLETEFPDRPETARAIRFTFLPPALLGHWMPGNYNMWNSDRLILETAVGTETKHNLDPAVAERLEFVRTSVGITSLVEPPLDTTRERLAQARAALDEIRPHLDPAPLALIDDLDDLQAAASIEDITPKLLADYAGLRIARGSPPRITAAWKPLAPFLDFLNHIRQVEAPGGYGTQANHDTIESWETYLAKYPGSPKSEAASLRLIRLKVRELSPIPHVRAFHFPEAPIPDGYKRLTAKTAEPDHPGTALLLREIAAHRSRFPADRYAADLLVLEAAAAAVVRDYPLALGNLTRILSDASHPELHQDASLYFAELSLRLLKPQDRPALVPAFRDSPEAIELVSRLAHGDTCVSRLRPLLPALTD